MKRHGIATVGFIAVLVMMLSGCGFFTKTALETGEDSLVPMFNTGATQEGGIEGIDYECIEKPKDISPPPPPLDIDKIVIIPKPLCPLGKVPQSKARFDNHPKGFPPEHDQLMPSAVFCYGYGACYDYVESYQYITNKGAFARLTQHQPEIDPYDGWHSLAEIAVLDYSRNIVEVGWRRARGDVIRLFVFWWVNASPQCYDDACPGWVQVNQGYYPGMPIDISGRSSRSYAIRYINNKWWVYYKSIPMGYYPSTLWDPPFTQADRISYFGEVASSDQQGNTTTDMGNGLWPSNRNAARIDDQRYWNGSRWIYANTNKWSSSPERYDYRATSSRSMRYGGPGCTSNC